MKLQPRDDDFAPLAPGQYVEGSAMSTMACDGSASIIQCLYAPKTPAMLGAFNISVNLPTGAVAINVGPAPMEVGGGASCGPLRFEMVKPFEQWNYSYDGPATI